MLDEKLSWVVEELLYYSQVDIGSADKLEVRFLKGWDGWWEEWGTMETYTISVSIDYFIKSAKRCSPTILLSPPLSNYSTIAWVFYVYQ